jgi:hypothetical protein
MSGRRRSIAPIACAVLLLQAVALSGCAPLLLLSGLLGGTGGGDHAPSNIGPLDGSPSAVQNALPADTSVQKALAMDPSVESACLEELPEQPPLPATGCTTRPSCVPGAKHPLVLRMCSGNLAAPVTPVVGTSRLSSWAWDASD